MFNSSKRLLPHMFCLIVMFLLPGAIDAQDITLADVALAPDTVIEGRNQDDFLGYAVAISGDVLAIGIPQADATDKNAGAVEIWVRDGHLWSLEQTLVGPNREDEFGFSVALQGNILVIGAPYADSGGEKDVGQVHVFSREGTTWVPQQTIIGSESTGQFGQTVAFDSDTLVVGAPYAIASGEKSAGLIYVYILDGGSWVLQQTISGLTKNDLLGWSIALSDDTLVAAAPLFDVGQNKDVGQAQVWTRTGTTWTYQQTLTGDVEDARFGWSVALDGDKLAVGVPYATIGEYGSAGIAQLYVRSGASWALQQTFAGLAADDLLGWSVTLKDGVLAVGAPQANPMGVDNAGASYVYSQVGSTWLLRYVVIGEQVEEQVGRRQAVGDSTLIIGDYLADIAAQRNAGRVRVFDGILAPTQDGCYVDSSYIGFTSRTFTVYFRCNNVFDVYGFDYRHGTDGIPLQTLTQAYTPGDVFEAADENILILVNTVIDGYAVTLRQPAAPISGSFTLGSITFAANTSGMATFRLDEFTLGDIYGRAIPNVIAPDPDTTITIVDS